MWLLYALAASLCWGMSYAASGPLLRKGVSPLIFFFGYSLFGFLAATLALLISGKIPSFQRFEGFDRADLLWFIFSTAGSALGAYLTYAAMGGQKPDPCLLDRDFVSAFRCSVCLDLLSRDAT